MIKAFLSHSSAQKDFVRLVMNSLGADNCFFDERTFENGMQTVKEICKAIGKSSIFVFFISDEALDSDWVKYELSNVRDYIDMGEIQFLPLIIDKSITHTDIRIKPWIRKDYNLQYYPSALLAARRIKEVIRDIAWTQYPELRNKAMLFQGRDEELATLRRKYYDGNLANRRCLVVSGFPPGVGRKKLIEEYIKRDIASTKIQSYEPIVVTLGEGSIEDLIFRLNDIVLLYSNDELLELNHKSKENKIDLVVTLIKEIDSRKEYCIVRDNGACVLSDGRFSTWFEDILSHEGLPHCLTLFLASSHFVNTSTISKWPSVLTINLTPLKKQSVKVLFYAYAQINNINIPDEIDGVISKIPGLPSYVFRIADLMKAYQTPDLLLRQIDELVKTEERSFVPILNKIQEDQDAFQVMIMLSMFEFLSIDIIESVLKLAGKVGTLYDCLEKLYAYGLFERIGGSNQYVRINAVVADYLSRNKIKLCRQYKNALRQVLREGMARDDFSDDLSGYLASIQKAIQDDVKHVDKKYLIPSFTLKVIIDEYKKKHYSKVITLSRRFLEDHINFYEEIVRSVRYWMCMAMCRLQDENFFSEAKEFSGYSQMFLYGFYSRCKRDYESAYSYYEKALRLSEVDRDKKYVAKAQHEIVIVLMKLGDYKSALSVAVENYKRESTNKYHVEAYFHCLIRTTNRDSVLLKRLLDEFKSLSMDAHNEIMFQTMSLEYDYYIKHDKSVLSKLKETVEHSSKDIRYYPYIALKKIAENMHATRAIDDLAGKFEGDLIEKDEELEE